MKKLCKVLLNTQENKKYTLLRGTLLSPSQALEQEIYFGYIDVAPYGLEELVETIRVVYNDANPFVVTEEVKEVVFPEISLEIPQDLIDRAKTEAGNQETMITGSIDYTTISKGGNNE
jgi:hypothetical protein